MYGGFRLSSEARGARLKRVAPSHRRTRVFDIAHAGVSDGGRVGVPSPGGSVAVNGAAPGLVPSVTSARTPLPPTPGRRGSAVDTQSWSAHGPAGATVARPFPLSAHRTG